MEKRVGTYSEFWPFYLSQHLNPVSRSLHFLGTVLALGFVSYAGFFDRRFLLFGLVAGYGPAWIGHFFFEKNRPATFRYPLWSLLSDFRMFGLICRGKLGSEFVRLGLESPRGRSS